MTNTLNNSNSYLIPARQIWAIKVTLLWNTSVMSYVIRFSLYIYTQELKWSYDYDL